MITSLAIIIGILVLLIVIVSIVRSPPMFYNHYDPVDEEVVTTHTTTTTTNEANAFAQPQQAGLNINGIPIVGMLTRQYEGNQPFVIDPVDKDKMFLNTKDDIYEDGAGKTWGLQ